MRIFRRTRGPGATRNRVRLALETLDSRLPPSSLLDPPDTPLLMTLDGGRTGNVAPQIVNFTAVEVVGGMWRFTGDVIDEAPGGLTITFGGEPDSLQGVTTTTDANGHFDIVLLLNTDGSDNGLASAQTVDGGGLASNVALYNINPG